MDYGYGQQSPYGAYDQSEMSAYSEYQTGTGNFSTVPVVSTYGAAEGNEQSGWGTCIGVCMMCLCVLGIIVVVFVLMQTSGTGGGDDAIDSAGDSSSGGSPGGFSGGSLGGTPIVHTVSDSTTASSEATEEETDPDWETTLGEDTGAPTPVQTHPTQVVATPPVVTTTTTTTKKVTEEPPVKELVCTVGHSAVLPIMYPADGVCDYMYYTYVVISYGRLRATTVKRSWTLFQDRAKSFKKTGAGFSFDARYVTTVQVRNNTVKGQLQKLVEDNIVNYGLLNTIAQENKLEKLLREVWAVIDELKTFQGYDNPTRKVIIALGMPDYSSGTSWSLYVKLLQQTVEKSPADTVIAISSTGMIESEQECYAVPPTVIKAQLNIYPSLDRFGPLVSVSTSYAKKTTVVGLSIEMSVMTYILDGAAPNPGEIPYRKCRTAGTDAAHIMCPVPATLLKQVNASTVAGFILQNNQEFVFLGESQETIKQKIEYMKKLNQRRRTAWLVYNVHMTDLQRQCLPERHFRVTYLKSLF